MSPKISAVVHIIRITCPSSLCSKPALQAPSGGSIMKSAAGKNADCMVFDSPPLGLPRSQDTDFILWNQRYGLPIDPQSSLTRTLPNTWCTCLRLMSDARSRVRGVQRTIPITHRSYPMFDLSVENVDVKIKVSVVQVFCCSKSLPFVVLCTFYKRWGNIHEKTTPQFEN